MFSLEDKKHMRRAIALAERGRGGTGPNPPVGAVVVKGGRVVGEGWHRAPGEPHAEPLALAEAGKRARGATLYVTLEPCNHQGKTPPCTRAIRDAGIARVIVARRDRNAAVKGGGLRALARAGIAAEYGIEEESAARQLEAYERHLAGGIPFVLAKVGCSADARIATAAGESQWITGEASRREVHRLRRASEAILIGRGTLGADDPALDVRLVPSYGHRPLRVVLDSHLSADLRHRVFTDGGPTLVACTDDSDVAARRRFRSSGIELAVTPAREGRVDLPRLLRELGRRGVLQLMVEGGSDVFASMIGAGLVDKLVLFMAPSVIGSEGLTWMGRLGLMRLSEAPRFRWERPRQVGGDVMLVGYREAD